MRVQTLLLLPITYCGVEESGRPCRAHNPKIAGSNPAPASNVAVVQRLVYLVAIQKMPVRFRSVAPVNVRVVELVDTPVLETGAERRVGSSPTSDTIKIYRKYVYQCEPKSLVHKNIWRVRLNDR